MVVPQSRHGNKTPKSGGDAKTGIFSFISPLDSGSEILVGWQGNRHILYMYMNTHSEIRNAYPYLLAVEHFRSF